MKNMGNIWVWTSLIVNASPPTKLIEISTNTVNRGGNEPTTVLMTLCWGALPLHCVVLGEWHACSWRVSLVEQELLTLSSPPVFSGVRVTRSLVLWIVVCPFVYFLLAIVGSVLLRCADSDCLPLVSSNSSLKKQD
jgi:hypothetical protein